MPPAFQNKTSDYRVKVEKPGTVLWGYEGISLGEIHMQTRITMRAYQDMWLFEKHIKSRHKTRGAVISGKKGGLISKFPINTYNANHSTLFFYVLLFPLIFKAENLSESTVAFSESQSYQQGRPVVLLNKQKFSTTAITSLIP